MTQDTPKVFVNIPRSAPAPKTPSAGGRRTEKSTEPEHFYKSFNMVKDGEAIINEYVYLGGIWSTRYFL